MSPIAARDIMLGVFRDAWVAAGLPLDRVTWDDKPENVPQGNATWARVTVRHYDGSMRAFGDEGGLFANGGTIAVQLFTPAGDANVSALNIAHALVKAFRAARTDVWFRNARFREVGTSGAFEQTNVLTDFTYDD